jgi:hypothetical protein
MIMTEIECKVVEAWRQAANDLGIKFTAPFVAAIRGSNRTEHLGLVHLFGRRVGTIISVLDQPSSLGSLVRKWRDEDYFVLELASHYGNYDPQLFIDTLNDWGFFGQDADRPEWYTGRPWGE